MKKFRYLLIIFGFLFCMIPNVNAEVKNFTTTVNVARHYNNSTFYNITPFSTAYMGKAMHAIRYQNVGQFRTLWQLLPQNVNFENNKNYTFAFWLYEDSSSYSGTNTNYHDLNPPVVILGEKSCMVKPIGNTSCGTPGNTSTCDGFNYEAIFYVECDFDTTMLYDNGAFNINTYYMNPRSFTELDSYIHKEIYYWDEDTSLSDINESVHKTNEEIGELNDNITNSNTDESQNQANSFFEGFESNDYGLSDIITMPLELIQSLTSNSCVSLSLPIPYIDTTFDLPCMSSIYQQYFGDFFNLYQSITFGFVAYWVVVKIFALVKGFKDPDDDKIEVMDL